MRKTETETTTKTKSPYSMMLDTSLNNRLAREAKRLNTSKVKIVHIALQQLFKKKKLDLTIN